MTYPKCLIWSQIQLFTVNSFLSRTWDYMSELALYWNFPFIWLKIYCKCSAQRFPKTNSRACSCRLIEIKKEERVRENWATMRPNETSYACSLRFHPPTLCEYLCLHLEISSAGFLRFFPPGFWNIVLLIFEKWTTFFRCVFIIKPWFLIYWVNFYCNFFIFQKILYFSLIFVTFFFLSHIYK
jgi:hypothetical protein